MNVIKGEKGKLPYGIYSKKHNFLNTFLFLILFTIIMIISVYIILNIGFVLGLLITCILTFISIIFLSNAINEFIKVKKRYFKTLDFTQFSKDIDKILNENIHSETKKSVILEYCNIMFIYDKQKALEMFEQLDEPNVPLVKDLYEAIKVVYFFNKGNYELCIKLIDEFVNKTNSKLNVQKNALINFKQIFLTTEEIKDFETKILKTNKKNKYMEINNYNALMLYYYFRNDLQKAKIYAQKIIDLKTNCLELNSSAFEILEKQEND